MSGEPIMIHVRTVEGYHHEVRFRGRTFEADEPVVAGGSDQGPTPEEMLLGALGSSVAITMLMYATRKEWPLKGVELDLRQVGDRIEKLVRLRGDLDSDQRDRLLQVGDHCPVQKMLSLGLRVETTA
jgi:putative redox protein